MTQLIKLSSNSSSFDFNALRQVCTICLQNRSNAIINGCSHYFCLHCIRKWSKNKKTCPMCRKRFNIIKSGDKTIRLRHRLPKRRIQLPRSSGQRRYVFLPIMFPINQTGIMGINDNNQQMGNMRVNNMNFSISTMMNNPILIEREVMNVSNLGMLDNVNNLNSYMGNMFPLLNGCYNINYMNGISNASNNSNNFPFFQNMMSPENMLRTNANMHNIMNSNNNNLMFQFNIWRNRIMNQNRREN